MHRSLLFTVASAASLVAADMGQAVVENRCAYPVYLQNTPAAGNGYELVWKTLNQGETYTQTWAPTTQGGWSIKLSKIPNSFENNILQYEYTCQNDGIIWYDLSEVNGNPFKGDWLISAPDGSGCDPKQAAYLFWNDDANGMQSTCPQETDIRVTLCNTSGSGSGSSNSSSPAPASGSSQSSPPAAAPASSSSSSAAPAAATGGLTNLLGDVGDALKFSADGKQVIGGGEKAVADNVAKAQTTMATSVKAAENYVATVTDIVTHIANVYVTQRAEPHLRHRHHARHGH